MAHRDLSPAGARSLCRVLTRALHALDRKLLHRDRVLRVGVEIGDGISHLALEVARDHAGNLILEGERDVLPDCAGLRSWHLDLDSAGQIGAKIITHCKINVSCSVWWTA